MTMKLFWARFKFFLVRLSLRKQLVVIFSIILIILSLTVAIVTSIIATTQIKDFLYLQGMQWSMSMAENSVVAFLYNNGEIVKDKIHTILETPQVLHIELVDNNGKKIIQQGESPVGEFLYPDNFAHDMHVIETSKAWLYSIKVFSSPKTNNVIEGDDHHNLINSMLLEEQDNELLGYVHLSLGKKSLIDIRHRIFFNNLMIALFASSVFIFLLLLLTRKVFRPLEKLSYLMQSTKQGVWQSAIDINGPSEIALISNAYNKMIHTLELRDKELININRNLEKMVVLRTQELREINHELETFNYSVSHDLRAPLRHIKGYCIALVEDYPDKLDETGKNYLYRINVAAQRMDQLIDDLLMLSGINRKDLQLEWVKVNSIVEQIIEFVSNTDKERQLEMSIESNLYLFGDPKLIRIIFENLLGNAWKYCNKEKVTKISIGSIDKKPQSIYIKDNGVGFDMAYSNKLFIAFHRLHNPNEFEGMGIGLATVERIVKRHAGKIWANSEVGQGATFYFEFANDNQGLGMKTAAAVNHDRR